MSSKVKMLIKKEILFCDLNPICYSLSLKKEILKRKIQDLSSQNRFAKKIDSTDLPVLISEYNSSLIKKGKDIDPILQENKARNIQLASEKIHHLLIKPGEMFSFWERVGNPSKRRGYSEGRILKKGVLQAGIGGGLCNLANTIHRIVLQSPLTVTEFHSHSDALAPDGAVRIPFSSGTSVSYNNVDYRFINETDQTYQLKIWCSDGRLYAELRALKELDVLYQIVEEDLHYVVEHGKYYRKSKIYTDIIDKNSFKRLKRVLVLNNHSEIMFDPDLLNEECIRFG
ncbi:MAG: VanW family protein [Spirochaetales bacterium]|nr:VanW family protein [Spirochaetales bacterium]